MRRPEHRGDPLPGLAALGMLLALLACGGTPPPDPSSRPAGIESTESTESTEQRAASGANDPWQRWNDPEIQEVPPFRIFDNLSYVGLEWVSAYVLETSDGLVLIDSLYGGFVHHIVRGIESLGLDPTTIRAVLATHGHFDHAGGLRFFREQYGARIGMTAADWDLAEATPSDPRFAFDPGLRDWVIRDGETLVLGDTTIELYVTPGHTEGVLSLALDVRDGQATHRAFMFGGAGLNFSGVRRTEQYLDSVARIRAMATAPARPIEVNIANHAGMGRIFERAEELARRQPGARHPFVDPEEYLAYLDRLAAAAREKLEQERQPSPSETGGTTSQLRPGKLDRTSSA